MVLNETSVSSINSSNFASIPETIKSAKANKIVLTKLSNYYLFENQITLGFPLLRKYENILKSNLLEYKLDAKFFMRPEHLSYELYGTADLWYLLLFVNNIARVEDFNKEIIYVPTEDVIDVMNTIINDESGVMSTPENPRLIKKDYLKSLSIKSDIVMNYIEDDIIPWVDIPSLEDNISDLFDKYFYYSKFFFNNNVMIDENKNLTKRETLDGKGLIGLPSIYYSDGFKRSFKASIYLTKGQKYGVLNLINGELATKVTDAKTGKILFNNTTVNKFSEIFRPLSVYDNRSANLTETKIRKVSTFGINGLKFDEDLGVYTFSIDSKNQALITDPITLYRTEFTKEQINNVSYPLADQTAFNAIINYNSLITNTNSIEYIDNVMTIRYINGTSKISKNTIYRPDIFDTNSADAYSHVLLAATTANIQSIEVKTVMKIKSTATGTFNFDLNINSVGLYALNTIRSIVNSFAVPTNGWYDLSWDYSYGGDLSNIASNNFIDTGFDQGIYFNPSILELNASDDPNLDSIIKMNDGGNSVAPVKLDSPVNPFLAPKVIENNSDIRTFTSNLQLPTKYMMTFKMTHRSISTGGGVGFILDYSPEKKTGYMIWISSKNNNPSLPNFNKDNNSEFNILQSGFYELDDIYGVEKLIFEGNNTRTIKVSNAKLFDPTGKTMRIVKKNNRLNLYFADANNKYDFSKPIVSIEDIANYHTNGGLGFYSIFAGLSVDILDFSTWIGQTINDDAEW